MCCCFYWGREGGGEREGGEGEGGGRGGREEVGGRGRDGKGGCLVGVLVFCCCWFWCIFVCFCLFVCFVISWLISP